MATTLGHPAFLERGYWKRRENIDHSIVPTGAELVILCAVNILYVLAANAEGDFLDVMNVAGPTVLIVTLLASAITMLRRQIDALWTPIFWIRITSVAYYGVGSIVPYFVNEETNDMMQGFYSYFPADVAKYNLVCGIFLLSFLISVRLSCAIANAKSHDPDAPLFDWMPETNSLDVATFGAICLFVGLIDRFFIILPHTLGLMDGSTPSFLAQLAGTAYIGYFLVTKWALETKSPLLYVPLALAAAELFLGTLEFSKTGALFPPIMIAIAYVYHYRRLSVMGMAATAIVALYFTLTPIVTYGRTSIGEMYGTAFSASFEQRLNVLLGYTPGKAETQANSKTQGGWARLSYISAGSFAINQWDAERPGDSMRYAAIVFVPRFLYPDKPNISTVGQEFTVAVNGNDASSTSPGIPPELYWNGGWPGVIFGALYVGALCTILSLYALTVMRAEAYHLLFVVLLGIRLGMRIDGAMVQDFIGPIEVIFAAHIALTFLNRLVMRRR